MVNFINLGGGDPLCTLHPAEGLYSWVGCRGYMRDSLLKLNQVDTSHRGRTVQCTGGGPSSSTYSMIVFTYRSRGLPQITLLRKQNGNIYI